MATNGRIRFIDFSLNAIGDSEVDDEGRSLVRSLSEKSTRLKACNVQGDDNMAHR